MGQLIEKIFIPSRIACSETVGRYLSLKIERDQKQNKEHNKRRDVNLFFKVMNFFNYLPGQIKISRNWLQFQRGGLAWHCCRVRVDFLVLATSLGIVTFSCTTFLSFSDALLYQIRGPSCFFMKSNLFSRTQILKSLCQDFAFRLAVWQVWQCHGRQISIANCHVAEGFVQGSK